MNNNSQIDNVVITQDEFATRLALSNDKVNLRYKIREEFNRLTGIGYSALLPYLPLLHDCKSVEDVTTLLADCPELLL